MNDHNNTVRVYRSKHNPRLYTLSRYMEKGRKLELFERTYTRGKEEKERDFLKSVLEQFNQAYDLELAKKDDLEPGKTLEIKIEQPEPVGSNHDPTTCPHCKVKVKK